MAVTLRDIVTFDVPEHLIQQAIDIRQQRDQRFGNIFQENPTDLRWVGEVGELVALDAFTRCKPEATVWMDRNVTRNSDLRFCGVDVEVKTVKRKVPMRLDYKAQITARHARKPMEQILFTCYEYPRRKLHLLGVLSKAEFLEKAEYYGEGDSVHADYTIRPGHEIYAVTVAQMNPVRDFLRQAMRQWRLTQQNAA